MLVYRISKSNYINDLSGEGARLYGSRWTPKGFPVVYTSENRALAALEFYVHGKSGFSFRSLKLATINIPDSASIRNVDIDSLPDDWKKYPAPEALQDIGLEWIKSGELVLKVPSVQVPNEYNYILNAFGLDIKKVSVSSIEEFNYDSRYYVFFSKQSQ